MTRSDVITKLKREGYAATAGRVRQALMNCYLDPMPKKAARGAYDFQPEHLRQLRWYLVHIRPGPRPLFANRLPIRGPNDRVRRLERRKPHITARRAENLARRRRQRAADATLGWLEGIMRAEDIV